MFFVKLRVRGFDWHYFKSSSDVNPRVRKFHWCTCSAKSLIQTGTEITDQSWFCPQSLYQRICRQFRVV